MPTIRYGDPLTIADQLDEAGVVCVENAVPAEWLAQARAGVVDHLLTHGEHDYCIPLPQGEHLSAADAFANSPSVQSLLGEIVRARFPDSPEGLEFAESGLRIIAGPQSTGEAFYFHYDASIVTMVVPIFMPDAERGNSGEFMGLFNKRPFRRLVVTNIVDKIIRQNRFYRRFLIGKLDRTDYLHRVDMEVGNVYLFWGYRSLHGNMPCEPGALRATLIVHLGRPHGSSQALTAAVRFAQSLRTGGEKRAVKEATASVA
ncbi:MAG TPA: hypothetical protein VH166_12195 [Mycobacterium sp.]|nr:hypothetical protein [Mycobacterium sp.]